MGMRAMRWNSCATLLGNPEKVQNPDGTWTDGEETRTEVFCNRYRAGLDESSNPDTGLMEIAEIQIRACDYSDQPKVELGGKEYQVTYVNDSGEFARLTLRRMISNV